MDREQFEQIQETFERIDTLDSVLRIFLSQRWDGWGVNDHFETTHFSLVRHYGPDSKRIDLPTDLNDKILDVIADYDKELKEKVMKL